MADTSQSILRRLRDLYSNPRGSLEQLVDQLNNFNKGRIAVVNDRGAGYRNLSQEERVKQIVQGALDNVGSGGLGALGVIKTKGGNWLTGSVENALKGLKNPYVDKFDAEVARWGSPEKARQWVSDPGSSARALNKWIEGPLTKYVKRDMATEGDPVRKLAEQGVLHYQPEPARGYMNEVLKNLRTDLAGGAKGASDLARRWEDMADYNVDYGKAGGLRQFHPEQEWLGKVDPNTVVYEPRSDNFGGWNDLGFSHLTDELSNALNPESGLPRHLLLTPEQMPQMGMEKAVRHVADINAWRAAQKAEANAKLAQSPAVHLVREYGENNPKGLRWVEIKLPEDLPEGWADMTTNGSRFRNMNTGEIVGKDPRRNQLADQLKYEGDTMGHCVGGYCDDVLSGRSRIFSLRDAKGEPHVTIETRPVDRDWGAEQYKWATENPKVYAEFKQKFPNLTDQDREFRRMFAESQTSPTQHIVQIKGKQNLKPKDEYLPFVQDFVRNHPEGGKWGDIGDLGNTGLRRTRDAWNDMEQARIREAGKEFGDYMTQSDIDAINSAVWPEQKFAHGGSVQGNTTWRPMELDGIIGYITE